MTAHLQCFRWLKRTRSWFSSWIGRASICRQEEKSFHWNRSYIKFYSVTYHHTNVFRITKGYTWRLSTEDKQSLRCFSMSLVTWILEKSICCDQYHWDHETYIQYPIYEWQHGSDREIISRCSWWVWFLVLPLPICFRRKFRWKKIFRSWWKLQSSVPYFENKIRCLSKFFRKEKQKLFQNS